MVLLRDNTNIIILFNKNLTLVKIISDDIVLPSKMLTFFNY